MIGAEPVIIAPPETPADILGIYLSGRLYAPRPLQARLFISLLLPAADRPQFENVVRALRLMRN